LAPYIDINDEFILSGGETKIIQATIDIPQLDGTILGALSFKTLNKNEIEDEDKISIHNELTRIIGIQINKDTYQELDFVVHEPYVEPMNAYYVIRLPIELNVPLLVKDVLLTYQVLDDVGN